MAISTAIGELMSMKTEIAFGARDVLDSSHAAKEFRVVASPVLMIIVSQFRWRLLLIQLGSRFMLKLWQFYGFDIILCGGEVVIVSSVVFEMFAVPTRVEHRRKFHCHYCPLWLSSRHHKLSP